MAKKFGKRGKSRGQQLPEDPRNMFGPPQVPRPSGPPASSTPLADYLAHGWPGVDSGYVVLPRSLAEGMSLPWQQQLVHLLAQFHQQHGRLNWPIYRVVPSRYERLVDLDEEQLAEAGYLVEIDVDGEMVYRERSGRKVEDPDNTTVLVSCLDPIVPPAGRGPARQSGPGTPPDPGPPSGPIPAQPPAAPPPQQPAQPAQQPRTPAPMNIGPQPVWHTTRQSRPPQPPQPPQPPAPPQQPERQQPAKPAEPPQPPPSQQHSPSSPPPAEQRKPEQVSEGKPTPQAQAEKQAPAQPPAPAQQPPAQQAPAQQPPGQPERQEPDTPPRGVERPAAGTRGWFDELPESHEGAQPQDGAEGAQFGPTGDPTEIPYRYRR